MDPNRIPSSDTILSAVLAFLGIPSGIIAMVLLARRLANWEKTVRKTVARARSLRTFFTRIGALPPVRIAAAVTVTLLVPCAQLLLLALWYITGQGLWLWHDPARGRQLEEAIRQEGYARVLRLAPLSHLLPTNPVSAACLVLCLSVLMIVYARAIAGLNVDKIADVLAVSLSLLLSVALTVITIDALIKPSAPTDSQWSAGAQPSAGKAWLLMLSLPAMGLAVKLGQIASQVAVRGTALLRRVWSGSADSPLTIRDLLGGPLFFRYWRRM
jgi:hypothetical protein